MEIILAITLLTLIYIAIKTLSTKQIRQKKPYEYQAKEYFMTKSESEFFRMLDAVASDRYFIFPQAHLSAILDHKVKNAQNWTYAFRHINAMSVDYVLCDKVTLKPTYAVELDDYTHKYVDRQERDREVERIFKSSGIPLVRFSDYKTLSQEDIEKKFFEARPSK